MKELTYKRTSKQPLELPSGGSTFKRPVGHFAGKLIDDAGLRGGLRYGGMLRFLKNIVVLLLIGERPHLKMYLLL